MMSLPTLIEVLYQFRKKPYVTIIYVDYDCTVSKDSNTLKRTAQNCSPLQSVEKPPAYLKMGSQGRSPRQGLGAVAPVKSPFPRERGQRDRDSKLEVCFKNRLFLQAEADCSKLQSASTKLTRKTANCAGDNKYINIIIFR